jgi:hypothetical protein
MVERWIDASGAIMYLPFICSFVTAFPCTYLLHDSDVGILNEV